MNTIRDNNARDSEVWSGPGLSSVKHYARPRNRANPILWAVNPKVNSNSHSTPITRSRRLLKALLSCHSCLVINYIVINRYAHNPAVRIAPPVVTSCA